MITGWESCSTLRNNVEQIVVSDSGMYTIATVWSLTIERFYIIVCPTSCLRIESCFLEIHVYQLSENSTYESIASNPSDPAEEFTAGTMTDLPCKEVEGLWESLFYEGNVKSKLLDYIYATIGFSDAGVDCQCSSESSFCAINSFTFRQSCLLEQGHPFARSTWNREDVSLQSFSAKAEHSAEG